MVNCVERVGGHKDRACSGILEHTPEPPMCCEPNLTKHQGASLSALSLSLSQLGHMLLANI